MCLEWITSMLPELFDILLAHGNDAIGTVRFNRKGLSEEVKQKKLKKGEIISRFNGKVMHMKWRDKKYVNMLSTVYDESMEIVQSGGKEVSKPTVCIKYKKLHMGGVDLMDQITSASCVTRKGVTKYCKKIFFRLIEMSLHNCHVIYKRNGGQEKVLDFKLHLTEQIVHVFGKDVYWIKKPTSPVTFGPCPTRLSGRHFPIETESGEGVTTKKVQRRCTYCAMQKKVRRSIYSCDVCQVALCITPCFKLYHTSEHLPK